MFEHFITYLYLLNIAFSPIFDLSSLKSADVLYGRPFCEEQPEERKGKKLRKLHVEHADLHIQKARPQK